MFISLADFVHWPYISQKQCHNPSVDKLLWKRTSQKRLEYFSKTCWREQFYLMIRLENVSKISLQDILKTSWRRLDKKNVLIKTSWRWRRKTLSRRLQDVLSKTNTCTEICFLVGVAIKKAVLVIWRATPVSLC